MAEEFFVIGGTRYDALRLLGHGKGGYSYLVSDGAGLYVVKRIHHEPCDYYAFGDKLESEKRDYRRLCGTGLAMPELIAADSAQELILKAYIEGETVYELVLRGTLPPELVERMKDTGKTLCAAGINIDYFPTNYVLRDGVLYYIDYECNDYMPEWSFENWGVKYWSRTEEFLSYASKRGDVQPV